VLAVDARYVPAAQFTHTVELVVAEYLPAAQAAQSESEALPSVARYVPASQSWHVSEVDASTVEYFPAGQLLQRADPVVLL
jgi:hypothetical protein